ncbi:hypothetical protein V3A08_08540 [Tenacibaculum maritimum]
MSKKKPITEEDAIRIAKAESKKNLKKTALPKEQKRLLRKIKKLKKNQ